MVTGVKPDEQVDWSEVAGAVACYRNGCGEHAVGRVSDGRGGRNAYCAKHVAAFAVAFAGAAGGGLSVERAAALGHWVADACEVSNV